MSTRGSAPDANDEQQGPEPPAGRVASTESGSRGIARQTYPVIFVDHVGKRFIFPSERCDTYESFKALLEQTYARSDERNRSQIQDEKFDLLTSSDEIILPSVWESVVRNHLLVGASQAPQAYSIKISFWPTTPTETHNQISEPAYAGNPSVPIERVEDPLENSFRRQPTDEGILRPYSPIHRNRTLDSDDFRPPSPIYRDRIRRVRIQSHSRSRSRSGSNYRRSRSRSRSRSPVRLPPEGSVRSRSQSRDSISSSYVTDSETGSDSASGDERAEPVPPPHTLPLARAVNRPLDKYGDKLSCLVDTKWPELHHGSDQETTDNDDSKETEKARIYREMKVESPLRILKALQVSKENRMSIQIHTLFGPETPALASSIGVRWYHLYGDHLDFAQFRSTCLGVQGLSSRMKKLIAKTLENVEKERLRAFLDGMFIEPGTVLRGDEIGQEEPESVIFSCVPYFEAQAPIKPTPGQADRYHPARTLMQSYYPYEPVRERDLEQAFKKFRTGSSNRIIHVPSIWVLNIDRYAVVTCGYRALAAEFVKSIKIIPESTVGLEEGLVTLERSGVNRIEDTGNVTTPHNLPNIRLTDWEGRVMLYTLKECRTYFEIEQRLRELRYFARGPSSDKLQLVWSDRGRHRRVRPSNWLQITRRREDLIFIDLSILDEAKKSILTDEETATQNSPMPNTASILPFFHWMHAEKEKEKTEDNASIEAGGVAQQYAFIPTETKRVMHCLDVVEKAMLSAAVDEYGVETEAERSFTSAKYYQSLPENSVEYVRNIVVSLVQNGANRGRGASDRTMHQIVLDEQSPKLSEHAATFIDLVHETLKLFVSDLEKSTMLKKVWGAMSQLATTVLRAVKRACPMDPEEFTNDKWTSPLTGKRLWYIRSAKTSVEKGKYTPLPPNDLLKTSIRRCRDCKHNRAYSTPVKAVEHLRTHLQDSVDADELPQTGADRVTDDDLREWIHNDSQMLIEETNAGFLAILNHGVEQARQLLTETRELAEGVRTPEGKISDLYFFPHELLKTLRRLVTYYLMVERSIHYVEDAFISKDTFSERRPAPLPFESSGLAVLKRNFDIAKTSLLAARKDLCNMARSKDMHDIGKRLSLSPEYMCTWFLRRLLVKPIDQSMTVVDLYREYLSTLQFQVNHRPSKRLLRSINLLQEELAALGQVNSWQANFIQNYLTVLDDKSYQVDKKYRRAVFPYEQVLLNSCLDTVADAREDFEEMIQRCGPLSESTKQSAEINEEDHGKAILVFTVVTIIFLPLSFVTSYLGMNTSDIRDMDNKQSLFWEIALPLTAVVMGSILFIAYNGDELRGKTEGIYRRLTGKQDTSASARGISVAQRKRASKLPTDSSSTLDYRSLADEAEFAPPRPVGLKPRHFKEEQFMEYQRVDQLNRTYIDPSPRSYVDPVPVTETYSHAPAAYDPYVPAPRQSRMSYLPPPPQPTTRSGIPSYTAPQGPELLPNSDFDGLLNNSAPTYIRIAKKYLDTETLAYYNLPWEYDVQDPDYFIIFKSLDQYETDAMFEHTKRLREREKSGGREKSRARSGRRDRSSRYVERERYDRRNYDDDDDRYNRRSGIRRAETFNSRR